MLNKLIWYHTTVVQTQLGYWVFDGWLRPLMLVTAILLFILFVDHVWSSCFRISYVWYAVEVGVGSWQILLLSPLTSFYWLVFICHSVLHHLTITLYALVQFSDEMFTRARCRRVTCWYWMANCASSAWWNLIHFEWLGALDASVCHCICFFTAFSLGHWKLWVSDRALMSAPLLYVTDIRQQVHILCCCSHHFHTMCGRRRSLAVLSCLRPTQTIVVSYICKVK